MGEDETRGEDEDECDNDEVEREWRHGGVW